MGRRRQVRECDSSSVLLFFLSFDEIFLEVLPSSDSEVFSKLFVFNLTIFYASLLQYIGMVSSKVYLGHRHSIPFS